MTLEASAFYSVSLASWATLPSQTKMRIELYYKYYKYYIINEIAFAGGKTRVSRMYEQSDKDNNKENNKDNNKDKDNNKHSRSKRS